MYGINPKGLPPDADIAAWLLKRPRQLRAREERNLDEPPTDDEDAHERWLEDRSRQR